VSNGARFSPGLFEQPAGGTTAAPESRVRFTPKIREPGYEPGMLPGRTAATDGGEPEHRCPHGARGRAGERQPVRNCYRAEAANQSSIPPRTRYWESQYPPMYERSPERLPATVASIRFNIQKLANSIN
jgi:hypothetical protein